MESSNDRGLHLVSSSGDVEEVGQNNLPGHVLKHRIPVIILINVRSTDAGTRYLENEQNYWQQFCNIYQDNGWITVQCLPTEDSVENGEALKIVRTLFSSLQNKDLDKNPIIIHVLGHTGLPVYNAVCQFVKDEQDLGNIISVKGCILDSCPKQPDGLMDKISEFWPKLFECLMPLAHFIQVLYPELFTTETNVSHYDTFCSCTGMWPQLYLYSTVDHIVPHTGVEKAANLLRNAGVPITTKSWDDTEHARHLMVHEEEYTELCQRFVHNALGYK